MKALHINGNDLTLEQVREVAVEHRPVLLDPDARVAVRRARAVVDALVANNKLSYAITTGVGKLSDVRIAGDQIREMQVNLVRSHAVGVGNALSLPEARAAMLLRTNTLVRGNSGSSLALLEKLVEIQNAGLVPWIPEQGSVGACGDLAPLAHMALTVIGEGRVWFEGKWQDTAAAFRKTGIKPHVLEPKEGLSLINGTQIMTAIGALVIREALNLCKVADIAGALSVDAFRGTATAFDERIQAVRPHHEQAVVAANLRTLLQGSKIAMSHKDCGKVQDPYSFRCMPQVHGASRRLIDNCVSVIETEMNSSLDNPLIFLDGDKGEILSGGNFHGEYIAMMMDTAAIGLSELANISDQRIQKLINPAISGLPAFLTRDAGLNSGMMIVQVASASLVSENKVLSHPASVDSISTSADKEDHVSMGVTAARKARQILFNVRNVLAMELLCGSQAVHLIRPLKSSKPLEAVLGEISRVVPPIEEDRVFHHDILAIETLVREGKILTAAGSLR
ncbi:MAG: histidine ammonia-lyase [Bdellovibrionota bacterium]